MRKNHKWTDEERTIVRRDYRHNKASCEELARRLGVTWLAVRRQTVAMGICKRTDYRPWTEAEKKRLEKLIPRYSVRRIAQMMHRSMNAVKIKSTRLKIYKRNREGWFTKRDVSEILGVDHHWIQRRIDSGALPATYHYGTRPTKIGMSAWHIEESDLKQFIRRYPEELNGRNVDMMMIVDILAGVINGQKE